MYYMFNFIVADGPYCNRTMDNFGGCWPDTLPGMRAKIKCPDIPSFNVEGETLFTFHIHVQ